MWTLIVNVLCIGMSDDKVIIGLCRICLNFVGGGIRQRCVFMLPVSLHAITLCCLSLCMQ